MKSEETTFGDRRESQWAARCFYVKKGLLRLFKKQKISVFL